MFITSASVDDNETYVEREFAAGELCDELVVELVRSLDGRRHTLVTLSPGGEAHLAIGGSARDGLVGYVTEDNAVFYNLRSRAAKAQGRVTVVAGGQPGEYDGAAVVSLEEAFAAAVHYAQTGGRAEELAWEVAT
ncbi:Imm1 family immunity protein [Kribbella sp. NBC_01505]|uniref:Imm1 family immunity protein n=1 Tax=Kribbella sp. NBC_01505 TaxID=2903580 RepID=UPI00386804F5